MYFIFKNCNGLDDIWHKQDELKICNIIKKHWSFDLWEICWQVSTKSIEVLIYEKYADRFQQYFSSISES